MLDTSDEITIPVGDKQLAGSWVLPEDAQGIIVFAHGSGSSRFSPRNQFVATVLQQAGFATLLLDLLDEDEAMDRTRVFDIEVLAARIIGTLDWLKAQESISSLPIGLFGASTGAAAALRAAAHRPDIVQAVVSRGGRPDLAWFDLPQVTAPTLLIVGELDGEVVQLNRSAASRLNALHELTIVPRATHLFPEPGALARVATHARRWFQQYLSAANSVEEESLTGFVDRVDAGKRLVARLQARKFVDPLVLAIPRGGVVLGAILADALHAELDVVLSRKLRMPGNPEYALGAISEEGTTYLNLPPGETSESMQSYLDRECALQMREIERRRVSFRQGRSAARAHGRSVIVTDDGIATGSTMIAALRTLRGRRPADRSVGPHELIVAVPVASPDRLREVRKECDEVVCLIESANLFAVGQFYRDFTQVEDEEVVALLERFVHS